LYPFDEFPTMVEVERAMIVAADKRSNRKSVEAAKLLGMCKTTFYRKLNAIGKHAAASVLMDAQPSQSSGCAGTSSMPTT
jgi:hypothetical protein